MGLSYMQMEGLLGLHRRLIRDYALSRIISAAMAACQAGIEYVQPGMTGTPTNLRRKSTKRRSVTIHHKPMREV